MKVFHQFIGILFHIFIEIKKKDSNDNLSENHVFLESQIFITMYEMLCSYIRSHGVMVSTLDFESSDPSSNLGGT